MSALRHEQYMQVHFGQMRVSPMPSNHQLQIKVANVNIKRIVPTQGHDVT
jgi:hypothetical protein